jgi:DNA-binding NarL/FixJ family response regulator
MLGGLLERLLQQRRARDEAARRLSRLTPREREVLTLLAQGGDNDSIARVLVISPQTARTHIQNVLVKLGVHSRLEAAAVAIQNGLVDAVSQLS